MLKYSIVLFNLGALIVTQKDIASETLDCLAFANMRMQNVFSATLILFASNK
jgi:hypothetical protein